MAIYICDAYTSVSTSMHAQWLAFRDYASLCLCFADSVAAGRTTPSCDASATQRPAPIAQGPVPMDVDLPGTASPPYVTSSPQPGALRVRRYTRVHITRMNSARR